MPFRPQRLGVIRSPQSNGKSRLWPQHLPTMLFDGFEEMFSSFSFEGNCSCGCKAPVLFEKPRHLRAATASITLLDINNPNTVDCGVGLFHRQATQFTE